MMQLIVFELKKQMKQKKLYLFLIVPLIFIAVMFYQNNQEQEQFLNNKTNEIENYLKKIDMHKAELQDENNENGSKQFQAITKIGSVLYSWKQAVRQEQYPEALTMEETFLNLLVDYEEIGGPFLLSVQERSVALQKNAALQQNHYHYINEEHAVDPLLFTVHTGKWVFSIVGIIFTILLFGNLIVMEKEGKTLPLLFTQPIKKGHIVIAKFLSILLIIVMTMIVTIGVAFLICILFGDATFYWQYPMYTVALETFTFVSPAMIIGRMLLYFVSFISFALSIALFVSCFTSSSFTQIIVTLQVLLFGYLMTGLSIRLSTGWNPFYLLHQLNEVDVLPTKTNILYSVWTIFLSLLILFVSIRAFKLSPQQSSKSNALKTNWFNPSKVKWQVTNNFYFELRKQWMHGLVGKVLLFSGLLVIVGFIYIEVKMNQTEQRMLEQFQGNGTEQVIKMIERNISNLERAGNADENSQLKESLQKSLDEYKLSYQLQTAALEGMNNKQYVPLLHYQIYQNQKMLEEKQNSINTPNQLHDLTLQATIMEKELLIERNIKPFLGGDTESTILDVWEDPKEQEIWKKNNERTDNSALYTLYTYFTKYAYWIIIVLFVSLLGVGIAGEYGKKNTILLVRTQPLKLKHLYTGKVLAASSMAVGSIFAVVMGSAIYTAIFNGIGEWNYPIFHYDSQAMVDRTDYNGVRVGNIGFHFIDLGDWVVQASILLLALTFFIVVVGHLFGLVIKNVLAVYVTIIAFCGLGYASLSILPVVLLPFIPFTYFDIPRILNGEKAFVLNNPMITDGLGIICLLVTSILVGAISYIISMKLRKYR